MAKKHLYEQAIPLVKRLLKREDISDGPGMLSEIHLSGCARHGMTWEEQEKFSKAVLQRALLELCNQGYCVGRREKSKESGKEFYIYLTVKAAETYDARCALRDAQEVQVRALFEGLRARGLQVRKRGDSLIFEGADCMEWLEERLFGDVSPE